MKKTNKINFVQIIFAVGFLIIALSIGYYFVIFLPKKDNAELELKRLELTFKQRVIPSLTITLTPTLLPTSIVYPTTAPQPTAITRNIRQECIQKIKDALNKAGDIPVTQESIFVINNYYRSCLIKSNLPPEDLLSGSGLSNSTNCTINKIGDTSYMHCY